MTDERQEIIAGRIVLPALAACVLGAVIALFMAYRTIYG
jgi:hypothetical protein